jgi:hypothetical protein
MITSILSLVAYLLPLIIDGLKTYAESQKGARSETNVQNFRQALCQKNRPLIGARLADQHDRVLAAIRGR